ncbi:MAG: MBL fold metallo-hydrolase [Parasporobacterium sp.]|nr:MBL fold metallo-hydrolase [Parasporobacterium sp.]
MSELSIACIVVGPLQTNCYVVLNEDTREALITDPGANGDFIVKAIDDKGYTPKAILITHGHFDHVTGMPEVRDHYGIPVYMNGDDEDGMNRNPYIKNPDIKLLDTDIRLKGGEKLSLAGIDIEVIPCPGHTVGGVSYYIPELKSLLAGDTLFYHSWGRTDFPGGSEDALMATIWNNLLPLPEDTKVYPGHGRPTTIGEERKVHRYQ